jgi:hypothetical protein
MAEQKHPIPWGYRLAFNWIEPIFAFSGAVQSYYSPRSLLAITNPGITYTDNLHPLFTQFTGSWLALVFNDAVTLRLTTELRIWSCLITAGLLSDVFYTISLAEDIGADVFFRPQLWDAGNWTAIVTTIPMALVKILFLARVGFAAAAGSEDGEQRRRGGGVIASGPSSEQAKTGPIKADKRL